jgi:hypothetical protein
VPAEESVYRPDMPDYGVYAFWPEPGENWYHPDDAPVIAELIPSNRVLKRTHYDGTYYHLQYGPKQFRVRPTMWCSVPTMDLEVGQAVEILSRHGVNDAGIGFIADILYDIGNSRVRWLVRRSQMAAAVEFTREDLRPLEVRYELRTGFYQHSPPRSDLSFVTSWLNVGSLTDDS